MTAVNKLPFFFPYNWMFVLFVLENFETTKIWSVIVLK